MTDGELSALGGPWHDDATAEKVADFLDRLASTANVTKSAEVSGAHLRTLYRWKEKFPDFAAAWREAERVGTALLEDEALRRAKDGCDRPVFYEGEQCGVIREYSDTLMIFLLKARDPDKYRERVDIAHSGQVAQKVIVEYPDDGRGT